ncbi:MAG TPA: two-component sensor histidine kinase [Deltaproteobacteria bacterium]|nr:two-component sensor histidine kinase [Deltaproteobacteria bacterium]
MNQKTVTAENEFLHKLKWIMFFRLLFTTILLGSTIIFQLRESPSFLARPLVFIYVLTAAIYLLSFIYSLILRRVKRQLLFAYIQLIIDTAVVTLILFVTGGFSSIFSFLYLVVIIYSSMLLFRRGSMIVAALCSIQYGIMVDLEYYGILSPFVIEGGIASVYFTWSQALFKIVITMVACFAVAFLSSLLSEQERETKKELLAMEAQVKRVEKMAVIGEMAAGLAHEIKNPLASLTGSIQLLREDLSDNTDHNKLMQIVLREADRLSSLVSDFLLFARPPMGKRVPIELKGALMETLELFEKDSSSLGSITINKTLIPNVWIEMDMAHLRQVLWNLLLNAAESIDGRGRIDIRMVPFKNRYIGVQISDNGCGIPDNMIQSIFDPFFTTKPNGTGLGLSIVHRIVESHNSMLEVESEKDKGTTFTLRFKQIPSPT